MPNSVSFFMERASSLNNLNLLILTNDIADKGIRQDFKYNGLFPRRRVNRIARRCDWSTGWQGTDYTGGRIFCPISLPCETRCYCEE